MDIVKNMRNLIQHSKFKIQRFKIQKKQNQTAISFGFGTMTYDYDNDRFNQGLKLQHPHGGGHSHCQGSWSKFVKYIRGTLFFRETHICRV